MTSPAGTRPLHASNTGAKSVPCPDDFLAASFGFHRKATLGVGSFSRILHVESPRARSDAAKNFALKVILDPRKSGVDPERMAKVVARLRTEFEMGRAVTHPMLRRYHQIIADEEDETRPGHALLMELIDAPPPTRVPFPLYDTLEILRHIANAVAWMHTCGFVHTGLTARALYFTTLGRPRLAGLADASRIGEVKPLRVSVPGYVAPETVAGKPAIPATTSFLYASLAYVLLLNRFPPAVRLAGQASAQITDRMIGTNELISDVMDGVPEALAKFVRAALVENPESRPDIRELLDELHWNDHEHVGVVHEPEHAVTNTPIALLQRSSLYPRVPERRTNAPAQDVVLRGHAFGYRVGRWLGDGAWSRVYLVEEPTLQRTFALKHIIASRADSKVSSRRGAKSVISEWSRCGKLSHPSLRKLHALEFVGDSAETATVLGLVMELLDATPLEEKALPPERLVGTLRAVASAVTYLHTKDLVHTNIKPRSIFMSELGVVKLAGTGQIVPIGTALERTRILPGFVAPELLGTEPLTKAVDVFAFAATAYNLATGLIAPEAAAVRVEDHPVPPRFIGPDTPIDSLSPTVPAAFSRLVQRALHHHPSRRPSIAELLAALG
jgi:serine/threonine protein kinase